MDVPLCSSGEVGVKKSDVRGGAAPKRMLIWITNHDIVVIKLQLLIDIPAPSILTRRPSMRVCIGVTYDDL